MSSYIVKEKHCPHCGKLFECFSQPSCICEQDPDSIETSESGMEIAVCPCPDCVKVFANLQK